MTKDKADPLERINLRPAKRLPRDYHCRCEFCKQYLGELIRPDGSNYSRLERRGYYVNGNDQKHIAKTPLHLARFCIQRYTKPGDLVLDPTVGAGTTVVEALNRYCRAVGVELEFAEVARRNARANNPDHTYHHIIKGDARHLNRLLKRLRGGKLRFNLVVNNPPYAGDMSQLSPIGAEVTENYQYDRNLPNLAFLRGEKYFTAIADMYYQAATWLVPGGHFCVGVKDQVKNKRADGLHHQLGMILRDHIGLAFRGTVLLRHHPTTYFINTYRKRFPEVAIPLYQTLLVFQRPRSGFRPPRAPSRS